ncbi:DNA gyrase subunit B, partial [Acinetobacter variabilis]
KRLPRLTLRYPITSPAALLQVNTFKSDPTHDQAYDHQCAFPVREAVQRLQPSLRPEITLETCERENAQGEKSAHYWPRVTVYVHNLPHAYL